MAESAPVTESFCREQMEKAYACVKGRVSYKALTILVAVVIAVFGAVFSWGQACHSDTNERLERVIEPLQAIPVIEERVATIDRLQREVRPKLDKVQTDLEWIKAKLNGGKPHE